jgi:hypothetical protein
MRLVVGDSFPVVDTAVQGDVDAEGQESHGPSVWRLPVGFSPCSVQRLLMQQGH